MTDEKNNKKNTGPLAGIRVFDMTRILAGPSAAQIMGDMGAEVIKIEKPQEGDDTRKWGPPFLKDKNGEDTTESAYYLCANRNKKSVTIDIRTEEGLALAKKLIAQSDVFFENFKTGSLDKYGLGYDQLKQEFPRLVYCSITGFGHTGPLSTEPGYDIMVQGMSGLMSITGPENGPPYKVGVAVVDLMAGMYALTGILAALRHRDRTGKGQFVDVALLDTALGWLANTSQYFLTSGEIPPRMGNAHATIVPYQVFEAADGHIILAAGNDRQYRDFCKVAGRNDLAVDPRFLRNSDRVKNRRDLVPILQTIISAQPRAFWIEKLHEVDVPIGPVNDMAEAFAQEQAQARNMTVDLPHPLSKDPVRLAANPLKFSESPVTHRSAPPTLGQHTDEVLKDVLGMEEKDIAALRDKGVI